MALGTQSMLGRFRVVIAGFRSEDALPRAAKILARLFPERPEAEIVSSLHAVPLLLATNLDHTTADKLRAHLESRGARVRILPDEEAPPPDPPRPHETGHRPSRHIDEPAPSLTTYRKVRPGIKDSVYVR